MALEKGIDKLVHDFIAAGRPSSRKHSIEDRRAGYVASTTLAGKTETRVQVKTLVLEGLTLRVFSPSTHLKYCLLLSTIMVGVLSAVGLTRMIINSVNWLFIATVGSLRFSTDSHPSISSPPHTTMQKGRLILSGTMPKN